MDRMTGKRRRGIGGFPLVGTGVAAWRMLRDGRAHWAGKLLLLLAVVYAVMPIDAIPELAMPIVGYLDDLGVLLAARVVLHRVLSRYRYPLGERRLIEGEPIIDGTRQVA